MGAPLAPWTKLWLIGGMLVFLGAGIPLLIILDYLPSTLWLLGGAALASMTGLFLGYYAMAIYIRVHRPPRDDPFSHDEGDDGLPKFD